MTLCMYFFFNDTATTEIYTLSLHDALPISVFCYRQVATQVGRFWHRLDSSVEVPTPQGKLPCSCSASRLRLRSEEHTSELQSRQYLVCRLLLEKKKKLLSYYHTSVPPLPPI